MTKDFFLKEMGLKFFISFISLVLALLVGGLVFVLFGTNPIDAYGALFKGTFGSLSALTVTLSKSVPLILTGLAVAFAFKCSVFNIGAEGQLLVGAMAAAIVGYGVQLPAIIHIPLTLLAAILAGMLWSFFPAILKAKANVHVVISTIMFNYIGQYLVQYLILGPFKGDSVAASTHAIHKSAVLPRLLKAPYSLNIGLLIALFMTVVVYVILNKTSMGFEMRAVGLNPDAARLNGISVDKNMFLALLISGALAGLAGGIEVTGSLGKIVNGFSPGYGFNGIPVALMARSNPFAIILTALLLGSLRAGSLMMQSAVGVSKNMIDIIQGTIIVFLCAESVIRYYLERVRSRREAK